MTLDDLVDEFWRANGWPSQISQGGALQAKAGIRAVVEALREDFAAAIAVGFMHLNVEPDASQCFEGADELISHILGSDAVEAATDDEIKSIHDWMRGWKL